MRMSTVSSSPAPSSRASRLAHRPRRSTLNVSSLDQFQFTASEAASGAAGTPRRQDEDRGDEIASIGAIRLPGKKERLADWLKNIDHFRKSAELGAAHVDHPAGHRLTLVRGVPADTPELRKTLADHANAYAALGNPEEVRALISKAVTLTQLAPPLVKYLESMPAPKPQGVDDLHYWSTMTVWARNESIVALHHLIFYRPRPDQIWVVDKNLYASRYFDAGIIVIGLYDAPDGNGFFAVAGSRVKSSQLGGVAGTLLRRQIQRSAVDTVKTYLEWMRDSLSMGS